MDVTHRDCGDHTTVIRTALRVPKSDNETQVETKNLGDYLIPVEQNQSKIRNGADTGKSQLAKIPIPQAKMAWNSYANSPYGIRLTETKIKKIEEKMNKEIKPLDIVTRRRLYQMYTFRRASGDNNNNVLKTIKDQMPAKMDLGKYDVEECEFSENIPRNARTKASDRTTEDGKTEYLRARSPKRRKVPSQKPAPNPLIRKPLINTVTYKKGNSTKVYKAVTFVESKRKFPLKIKLDKSRSRGSSSQSQNSKQKSTTSRQSTMSNLSSPKHTQRKTSPSSIEQLIMNRKHKNKSRKRNPSPECKVAPLPQTEVAKWAPQSVTEHTKPYYEAWVNTTLTATTTDVETVRSEKERILEQMRQRLEYQSSCYGLSEGEISDEKYTGRIVVTHS